MSRITGYVYNDYGRPAQDIELEITGLDSAGQPVRTVVQHTSDTVPAPMSPSYRVSVESFDFVENHGRN